MANRQAGGYVHIEATHTAGDVEVPSLVHQTVVDEVARLEILHEGKGFFEGPNWIQDRTGGYLIFTDIAGNSILKWTSDGVVSTVADGIYPAGDTSRGHLFEVSARTVRLIGPNGTTLDDQGRIVFCSYGAGEVVRIEHDGRRTVVADRFAGKHLNTPNDLVFRSDGILYFTDSAADVTRAEDDPDKGVPHSGVYLLKDGEVRVLIDDFVVPNGLAFSPDERYLYVNDTRRKLIFRYDVKLDGSVFNGTIFVDMNGNPEVGVPDGMKVDRNGYVYCTGPGGLWIIAPTGEHAATIRTPERLTNLAFGGADGRTLFMTGPSYVYRIALM
jgi:gluconolactonase